MKHTIQKLVALVCALAITMSWLPVIPVMAEDAVEEIGGSDWSGELKSGSYRLVGNIELTTTQTLDGNLTIDLAGHTLTAGATPIFKVPAGATLTITDSKATDEWKTNGGGKVLVAEGGGSKSMVELSDTGVFNLAGGTLTGHTATAVGSVVQTATDATASFNMSGGVISGNTSSKQGSVAMIRAGSAMTMSGGKITGNSSTYSAKKSDGTFDDVNRNGAAVYIAAGASFTMENGEISGNYHATYSERSANVHNRGTMTVTGGTIGKEGGGEAIYNLNQAAVIEISGNPTIIGKGIQGNYAEVTIGRLTSGARVVSGKALTVSDETVKEGQQGGLYIYSWKVPGLKDQVSPDIFAEPGDYVLAGDTTLTGSVTLSAGEYTIDLAGYTLTGNATPLFTVPAGAVLTITDSKATDEWKTNGGGKVLVAADGGSDSMVVLSGTGVFNLAGGTMTGHTATAVGSVVQTKKEATASFNMSGGVISGNASSLQGSVAHIRAGSAMTMSGGKITGNSSTYSSKEDDVNHNGAAVYIAADASFTMENGEISGNGHATYSERSANVHNRGTMTVTGGTIGIESGDGAAIFNLNALATLAISGNPVIIGGGVQNDVSKVTIGELSSGARVVSQKKLTVASAAVKYEVENELHVYTWKEPGLSEEVNPSVFAEPGEYTLTGNTTLIGTVTLSAGEYTLDLAGHTLSLGAAKGPFFKVPVGTVLTVKDTSAGKTGTVQGIQSTNNNGMLYVDGGVFNLEGGKLTGHISNGMAGAVHMTTAESSVFNMSGGEISGNTTSAQGSAVMIRAGVMNMSGGKIVDNICSKADDTNYNGAAIYVSTGGVFNMTGGEISGNYNSGNSKYNANIHNRSTVNITGGTIGKEGDGTAVHNYDDQSVLTISGEVRIAGTGIQKNVDKAAIGALRGQASVVSAGKLAFGDDMTVEETLENGVYTYTAMPLPELAGAEVLIADTVMKAGKTYYLTGGRGAGRGCDAGKRCVHHLSGRL